MKKLFVAACMAVAALSANAQTYVGGEVGLWRDAEDGANQTSFTLAPEIGYNLNDTWALGIALKYGYLYNGGEHGLEIGDHELDSDTKTNAIIVSPYVRATFARLGKVRLFLDGGFSFATAKVKYTTVADGESKSIEDDAKNGFEIGIKPGISVDVSKNLSFIAHAGFLGYRHSKNNENTVLGKNGFGFDVISTNLSFGFIYNF